MFIKLLLKAGRGGLDLRERAGRCFELLAAKGADCYAGNLADMLHDPDSPFWHEASFPQVG